MTTIISRTSARRGDGRASGAQLTATSQTVDTPDGPFTILAREDGAVLSSGWSDDIGVMLERIRPADRPGETVAGTIAAMDAVRAYYDGDLAAIDFERVTREIEAGLRLADLWGIGGLLLGLRPRTDPVPLTQHLDHPIGAEAGEVVAVSPIRRQVPVDVYLHAQRRFAHLFGDPPRTDVIAQLQARADRNIRRFGLLQEEVA